MRYFNQEDFNKCIEFLADKPDTVETQQGLHNYMVYEHIYPEKIDITVKDFTVYINVYKTATKCPKKANWCATMSDGTQVVWNRKYQEFFRLEEIGMGRCSCLTYLDTFPEIRDIDEWLLESWSNCRLQETQKQLVAIWNGKYDENFRNYWRQ